MKVFIVTHHYIGSNSGGSFASRAYINAFADIATECRLLYPDNGKKIEAFIPVKVIAKGVRNKTTNLGKLIDVYRGRINRYYNVFFQEIEDFQPDIVVFDNSRTSAGYIRKIRNLGIKSITIHHNYEKEYYKGTKPPLLWRHAFIYYMNKSERNAVLESDLNLTLTQDDLRLLQKDYDINRKSKFACLGVFEYDSKERSYNEGATAYQDSEYSPVFAITGSLSSYQTETCLIPFLEEYYPMIVKNYPKSKLIVAGRNPTAQIVNLCEQYNSIELIHNPENMELAIKDADIYICPISIGGGLKLRVMDGLKLGLPVLTHYVSARGYESFKNVGVLFEYGDIRSFEENLNNIVSLKRPKETVKDLYVDIFSLKNGTRRLKTILESNNLLASSL